MKQSTGKTTPSGFSSKVTSVKWLFRILWGIGISVVYYFIFSIFFDTPIEREIKKSTVKLEEQYQILQTRYDSVHGVLQNIKDRDKGVHRILFEADPYTSLQDSIISITDLEGNLLGKSNMELGDEMINRVGQLYQRERMVSAKLDTLLRYAVDNRKTLNMIPAIQPIDNPDFKLLTASFGVRVHPFKKTMNMHTGVDFSVPVGTAVFATADGTVMEIQSKGQSSGVSIRVKHGSAYETIYSNLSHVVAGVGQKVNRGDVIALSGDSGMSFAPHLHYEVRVRGQAVDPINYFFLEVGMNNLDLLRRIAASGMQSFD